MASVLAAAFFLVPPALAADIVDDFDDGDDVGWTRADLIGMATGGSWATYTFPAGNSYRISARLNDINSALGPARAGSYRADATYNGSFKIAVDIVNWSPTLAPQQDVGLLALAKDVGPGMLDCYACSYDTDPGDRWRISSVVNDGGTLKVSFPAAPGRTYKFACNADLASPFVVEAGAIYSEAGGVGTLAIPISPGNRFCRVIVEFPDPSPCVP